MIYEPSDIAICMINIGKRGSWREYNYTGFIRYSRYVLQLKLKLVFNILEVRSVTKRKKQQRYLENVIT